MTAIAIHPQDLADILQLQVLRVVVGVGHLHMYRPGQQKYLGLLRGFLLELRPQFELAHQLTCGPVYYHRHQKRKTASGVMRDLGGFLRQQLLSLVRRVVARLWQQHPHQRGQHSHPKQLLLGFLLDLVPRFELVPQFEPANQMT